MLGPRPRNGNEARHGISVARVRGNLREWKVSREWIQNLFRESFCRLETAPSVEKFLSPDRFRAVHRILEHGCSLCNKRRYNQEVPRARLWERLFKFPTDTIPAPSRVHVFKSKWNQFHIFEIIAEINSIVSISILLAMKKC